MYRMYKTIFYMNFNIIILIFDNSFVR